MQDLTFVRTETTTTSANITKYEQKHYTCILYNRVLHCRTQNYMGVWHFWIVNKKVW